MLLPMWNKIFFKLLSWSMSEVISFLSEVISFFFFPPFIFKFLLFYFLEHCSAQVYGDMGTVPETLEL